MGPQIYRTRNILQTHRRTGKYNKSKYIPEIFHQKAIICKISYLSVVNPNYSLKVPLDLPIGPRGKINGLETLIKRKLLRIPLMIFKN